MSVYLDHHAATPLSRAAADAMEGARDVAWANPSSPHGAGREARRLVERAREQVAAAVGATPNEVIFVSGGTEACAMGVRLAVASGRALTTTDIEHPAVRESMSEAGARTDLRRRPPEPEEALVAQWINHETGLIMPVEDWCAQAALSVLDATQALGKRPISWAELGADAIALASHKVGGPSGAGALILAREHVGDGLAGARGGGQERGRRPGTPGVEAIVGFGAACASVGARLAAMPRVRTLRDRLREGLVALGAVDNGGPEVADTAVNISVRGGQGPALVAAFDLEGIAIAAGPACSSGVAEPSRTVAALYPEEPWRATGALRLTLGPETTREDIDATLAAADRIFARLAR